MSYGNGADQKDYYEALQLSPHADAETVERVFRHLAKRFHPDNGETGDSTRFATVVEAYRVLSDPERRAAYDAGYSKLQEQQWKLFDQASAVGGVEGDRRIRLGILTVLYQARRRDVDRPGVGVLDLERILDCPQDHMKFHLWYMREKGWLERQENGTLAITASGIEYLNSQDLPWVDEQHRLRAPGPARPARPAGPSGPAPTPRAETEQAHAHSQPPVHARNGVG